MIHSFIRVGAALALLAFAVLALQAQGPGEAQIIRMLQQEQPYHSVSPELFEQLGWDLPDGGSRVKALADAAPGGAVDCDDTIQPRFNSPNNLDHVSNFWDTERKQTDANDCIVGIRNLQRVSEVMLKQLLIDFTLCGNIKHFAGKVGTVHSLITKLLQLLAYQTGTTGYIENSAIFVDDDFAEYPRGIDMRG